ncbi:hypothetical protein FBU30_000918 [Linnemannia zychae]|nr:hypothetical protein FBU30_000918 [Linnemannia zychae]
MVCLTLVFFPLLSPQHIHAGTTAIQQVMFRTIALVAALSAFTCSTAAAGTYQQVSYSATAVLENRLFVYGGLTNLSSPTSYTSQFLTLSLADEFDSEEISWEYHTEGSSSYSSIATAMAFGSPSGDYNRFIVTGNLNNIGRSPAFVYDTDSHTWNSVADLPTGAVILNSMQNYQRDSPGVALDKKTGMLIEFGGRNATSFTNEISILDTTKPSDKMTWSYSGFLENVPDLYAPVLTYLPSLSVILIMGGCDQMGVDKNPSRCASFDTLYALSSDSIKSNNPQVTRIKVAGTVFPPPRVFTCAIVRNNNIMMLGGGDPLHPLQDVWTLHTNNWTWTQEKIDGFPSKGIMGHSCHLMNYDQVLVVGGHNADGFSQRPISVIKLHNMLWQGHYYVAKVSLGAKVGLGLSIVVVVGAIAAGLYLRRRRMKTAEHRKQTSLTERSKEGSATSENINGRRRRVKRSRPDRNGGTTIGNSIPWHQQNELGSFSPASVSSNQQYHDSILMEPLADHERTLHGDHITNVPQGLDKPVSYSTRSINGSTLSTVIDATSPRIGNVTMPSSETTPTSDYGSVITSSQPPQSS